MLKWDERELPIRHQLTSPDGFLALLIRLSERRVGQVAGTYVYEGTLAKLDYRWFDVKLERLRTFAGHRAEPCRFAITQDRFIDFAAMYWDSLLELQYPSALYRLGFQRQQY